MTRLDPETPRTRRVPRAWLVSLTVPLALAGRAQAQAFESGSTGADGALTFPAGAGTITFDPASYSPPLDPDGDRVFHFTTITIPAGTTVVLSAGILGEGRPVVWLASGDVSIAGTLNLDGQPGHAAGTGARTPSIAGAGGWGGGRARRDDSAPSAGNGPGGGPAGTSGNQGANASHAYGNELLLPLLGGSGGGGSDVAGSAGAGGGAGGGAILIASSTRITLAGQVLARGGNTGGTVSTVPTFGGAGAGGAVRLVAPHVSGTGTVNVTGGSALSVAAPGRVRIETYQRTTTPTVAPANARTTHGTPSVLEVPAAGPRVRLARVGGVDASPTPSGSFEVPDAVIAAAGPVTVELAASGVPLGTVLTVTFQPEDGAALTATSSPLTGTLAASTATVQVTFPSGFTRVFVQATWTP